MNPGYRYHVASMASVFFALGIGVVMGTLVVGGKVVDRQSKLVQQLERRMEELQVEIKRRGQSDVALMNTVNEAAKSLWRSQSASIVIVERANGRKVEKAISAFGIPVDLRNISIFDDKWSDDDNRDVSPAISLKLDGSDDKGRVLVFVIPSATTVLAWSKEKQSSLITLMNDEVSLGCKVVVVTADDGNEVFINKCISSMLPVVTNMDTTVGLSAVILSPWAKPLVYGAGPYTDLDIPDLQWKVTAP